MVEMESEAVEYAHMGEKLAAADANSGCTKHHDKNEDSLETVVLARIAENQAELNRKLDGLVNMLAAQGARLESVEAAINRR